MLKVAGVALALYLLAFLILWLLRISFIYPFDSARIPPGRAGEPRLTERILETGGEKLIVWTAPAQSGRATVIYFHGNAGNLANRTARFSQLLDRGYGVIALGYRGSSGSSGRPDEALIQKDALALLENLPELTDQADLPRPWILYGESLGTGVVVYLAATDSAARIDGLILEAPYQSIVDLAATQFWAFPVRLVLDQRWASLARMPKVHQPLLVLHGDTDRVVPTDQGRQIFKAAGSMDKSLVILAGKGHADVWQGQGQAAIFSFLKKFK